MATQGYRCDFASIELVRTADISPRSPARYPLVQHHRHSLHDVRSSAALASAAPIVAGSSRSARPSPPSSAPPRRRSPRRSPSLVQAVDIPYEQFTLPNGLRVIVHTDRKAPVVAVSVWYDVGSKHEPKGKTGFAHLFEHLMFNG